LFHRWFFTSGFHLSTPIRPTLLAHRWRHGVTVLVVSVVAARLRSTSHFGRFFFYFLCPPDISAESDCWWHGGA